MFKENNLEITKPVIANKFCQSLSPSLYRGSTISPKAACIQERMSYLAIINHFAPISDMNECNLGVSPCSFGCDNKQGGFSCRCPHGYHPIGGG